MLSASPKSCDDKGNDLFYVEHLVQCLVLNWSTVKDVLIIVSLRLHNALDGPGGQTGQTVDLRRLTLQGTLRDVTSQLVLHTESPQRVRALAKGTANGGSVRMQTLILPLSPWFSV